MIHKLIIYIVLYAISAKRLRLLINEILKFLLESIKIGVYVPIQLNFNLFAQRRLIDWIEFYAISEIFQPCNGGNQKRKSMKKVIDEKKNLTYRVFNFCGMKLAPSMLMLYF